MKLTEYILTGMLSLVLSMVVCFGSLAAPLAKVDPKYSWTAAVNKETGIKEWSCRDSFDKPVTGWAARDDKSIYYLDKSGVMRTGWVKYKGGWYYLDEKTGILKTNAWVDNYFVGIDGKMTKIK